MQPSAQHEEHEGDVEDEEDDGVPVILEMELNHGFPNGLATAFKRGQSAGVEAVVSLVTFEEVRTGDVRASWVNLGANDPGDEEVGQGHDDSDNRQKTDGEIGAWHGFESRHWFTHGERIRSPLFAT